MNKANRIVVCLFLILSGCGQIQAQQDKIDMAHHILNGIATDKDFSTAFTMLEKDAGSVDGWHEQLLGFCKDIYSNDSIPDKELAFADRTLEALASSPHTPKTVVANACVILGNIAFNARDCAYLDLNIQRLQQAAATLAPNRQLDQAIQTLKQRREIIREYTHGFKERMQGTWVSAEVRQMFDPIVYIHIMPDSVRRDEALHHDFYLSSKIQYDKLGQKKDIAPSLGTKEIVYSGAERKMAVFFGYNKLDNGSPIAASVIAKAGEQLSGSLTRSVAVRNKRNPYSAGDILGRAGSELLGGLTQLLAVSLSEKVNYTYLYDYYITEIVPGIAKLDIVFRLIKESSQTGVSESHEYKTVYLYKIYPSDKLAFARYSAEKYERPFIKDYAACPAAVEDLDAYLSERNNEVVDSIQVSLKKFIEANKYLRYYPAKLKSVAIANNYMIRRLTDIIQERLDKIPVDLMDSGVRQDIQEDIDYRSKFQGLFSKEVTLEDFGNLGTVQFKGVYRIIDKSYNDNYNCPICRMPKELGMMQLRTKGLPLYYPQEYVNKWLRKYTDPINGTLRWKDKNGNEFLYEGQVEDRNLNGRGRLLKNNKLIHDGEFKDGKPV